MHTVSLLLVAIGVFGELPDAAGVKVHKVFETPSYCEGIVFDHQGFGYVSHDKVITRFTPDGKHSTWAQTGRPNGHKVLADGTHLVRDASRRAVLHLGADGKVIGKASFECDGKPLRGPNDLTLDVHNDGFYFTDPGGSDDKTPIGTVHYVDGKRKTHLLAEGLAYPNGIVLTPDGKKLYVAESKKNRVLVFEVTAPGKFGPQKVFAELPAKQGEQIDNQPDGMCLDAAGNLYVAHFGMKEVQVLNPQGKMVRRYPGGNLTTSNVGFGGPKLDQLYITGGLGPLAGKGGLFRIELPSVTGHAILPQALTDAEKHRAALAFNKAVADVSRSMEALGLEFGKALGVSKDAKVLEAAHTQLVEKADKVLNQARVIRVPPGQEAAEFWSAFNFFLDGQETMLKKEFKDLADAIAKGNKERMQIILQRVLEAETKALQRLRAAQQAFAKANDITIP